MVIFRCGWLVIHGSRVVERRSRRAPPIVSLVQAKTEASPPSCCQPSGKVVEDSISCSWTGARRPHGGFRGLDRENLMRSANGHPVDGPLRSRIGRITALVKEATHDSGV